MTGAIVSIVDDDADVLDSLQALLESAGFEVRSFDSASKVQNQAQQQQSQVQQQSSQDDRDR